MSDVKWFNLTISIKCIECYDDDKLSDFSANLRRAVDSCVMMASEDAIASYGSLSVSVERVE